MIKTHKVLEEYEMKDVNLIDVTLRDGGYKNNFNYSYNDVERIINGLDGSGVTHIEVGYRNGSFKPIPNIGITGTCPDHYLTFCRKLIQQAKLTVILHPKNLQLHELEVLKDLGVDTLRICIGPSYTDRDLSFISYAKQLQFEVSANITRSSQYAAQQIGDLAGKLLEYGADIIYLADSNGGMTPQQVRELFLEVSGRHTAKLGFHAHDNLFLAQANSIAALECGANFLDASLLGFGKGSGNLRTEGFASYLHSQGIKDFDVCKLLETAEFLKNSFSNESNPLLLKDVILGLFNLSQDDSVALGNFQTIKQYYSAARNYYLNRNSNSLKKCVGLG
ncbi:MAG: 4-hydroxy-2-oxovalerate aldolase [Gammaproteobacteria bacterium]|jgi:4-hydroxy 2-oxovalerate aldolase|nr:4-hydroxy-2-oxovalerate aldolase [Gammaproteobacteria bacterium]